MIPPATRQGQHQDSINKGIRQDRRSVAMLELVQLQIQLATESAARAKQLHEVTVRQMSAEHDLKMKLYAAQIDHYKSHAAEN